MVRVDFCFLPATREWRGADDNDNKNAGIRPGPSVHKYFRFANIDDF